MTQLDKVTNEASDKVLVVFSTCPADAAQRIADALVTDRLAACVNQVPSVTSTYVWEGSVQTESEVLLIIKTTEARFEALKTGLKALHSYELPELIAIPVCAGAETYLAWIRDTVK